MGRIFIGLVKCGAWGCFDEFNCLEEAMLSAVSIQIQTIQDSIWTSVLTTELLGREVCEMEVMQVSCDQHGIVQSLLVLMFCGCCVVSVHWEVLELLELQS